MARDVRAPAAVLSATYSDDTDDDDRVWIIPAAAPMTSHDDVSTPPLSWFQLTPPITDTSPSHSDTSSVSCCLLQSALLLLLLFFLIFKKIFSFL